jgi:transposase
MLRMEEWMDLKLLATEGRSIREISEMTGKSRNTVRRALRQRGPEGYRKRERKSKVEEYKDYLEKRYKECGLSAVRMAEEIRSMGYRGSVDTVRRVVRSMEGPSRAQEKLTVRYETPPGHQGQADWGSLGRFRNQEGKLIPIYVFVIVLGFSRYMYIEFTTSMKLPMLIGCHQRAFAYFGGWPATLLFDNMKQVKLGPGEWNPLFMDFANHHWIAVKTHRVRRPRTKGKVERMVKYVKENFLNGRSFADLDDLNVQGLHWLATVANVRLHGTTGKRPIDLLSEEKLTKTGTISPYQITDRGARKVDRSGFVRWGGSRYSVAPTHTGKVVLVEQGEEKVTIKCEDLILAEHGLAPRRDSTITTAEHIEELWKLSLLEPSQPQRHWDVTFGQDVAVMPLNAYEEVTQNECSI